MTQYTIFCIDFENNPFAMNVFNNWLADEGISYKPVIGNYKGVRENAYIVNTTDFDARIRNNANIKQQESVLHVAGGNKMEATLEFLADGRKVGIGCMHEVCQEEAALSDNWTYRPDMNTYWIAKHGNPDGSLRRSIGMYRDTGPVFDNTRTGESMAAQ